MSKDLFKVTPLSAEELKKYYDGEYINTEPIPCTIEDPIKNDTAFIRWISQSIQVGDIRMVYLTIDGCEGICVVYAKDYPEMKSIRSSFRQREFLEAKFREKFGQTFPEELTRKTVSMEARELIYQQHIESKKLSQEDKKNG